MLEITNSVLSRFWGKLTNFLPDFFGGLLILVIGLILAELIKKVFLALLSFFKLDFVIQKSKLMPKGEVILWEQIISELIRWTIIILFLVPTLEVWGLSKATGVLNQFLFYLPNVIVAVIIGFVGLIIANLTADVVRHSIKTLGSASANTLSLLAKSTVIFFTILIALSQLGVAQDLIRILFTGIVAMLALAGGLAFGLGGQEMAKSILEELKNKFK